MKIVYLSPKFDRFVRYDDDKSYYDYVKRVIHNDRKASGGIQIIYEHCDMLNKHSIEAKVASLGGRHSSIIPDWFEHITPMSYFKKLDIDNESIVVIPEVIPHAIERIKVGKKLLFVQNWALFNEEYDYSSYDGIIALEDYCTEYIKERVNLPIFSVRNGIDLKLFTYEEEKKLDNKILILYRKNQEEIDTFMDGIKEVEALGGRVEVVKEHLSKDKLIEKYKQCDIYLSFAYPEGFALPPLEAMACGACVIGYTGRGGRVHMHHNESALVAEDGDLHKLKCYLLEVLKDKELKERIRQGGLKISQNFDLVKMEESVVKMWQEIGEYYDI